LRLGFSQISGDQQAIAIGATNLIFTIVGMSVIDKLGRKTLLLIGAAGTASCLAGVAWLFDTQLASRSAGVAAGYLYCVLCAVAGRGDLGLHRRSVSQLGAVQGAGSGQRQPLDHEHAIALAFPVLVHIGPERAVCLLRGDDGGAVPGGAVFYPGDQGPDAGGSVAAEAGSEDANAFSFVGGYVYVSRKLITDARNEDEIAGVLAHEIGHIYTHQVANEYTRLFKVRMNLTSLGNQDDVNDKMQQLLNARVKYNEDLSEDQQDKDELLADRVGCMRWCVPAMRREHSQRISIASAPTKGILGSFLTDMLDINSIGDSACACGAVSDQ
jgi:hypothetical protein